MNKKTILIILGVSFGGCCLLGMGSLVLAALVAEPEADARANVAAAPSEASAAVGTGDPKLGGYMPYGSSKVAADGFAESLVGNWLYLDGAAVDSIESIHSDHVMVKRNSVGWLYHYSFDGDGSYAFRYVITGKSGMAIWTERGTWASDGSQLTLNPESCTSKASGNTEDCFEGGARSYALTTMRMEEFTLNGTGGASWPGVRFTGPFPSWAQGANPELQRVQ